MSKLLKVVSFLGFVVLSELAGVFGGLITVSQIPTWYQTLEKPSFSPPPSIFGPVWIILYALMGIATYYVWKEGYENKDLYAKKSVNLFLIHLLFNALWTPLFFGLHSLLLAQIDIVIVLVLAILVTLRYRKVNRTSFYLMIPYILWASFATILNLGFLVLNW